MSHTPRKDDHAMSWNSVLIVGGTGYVLGGLSVALVIGLLFALRRARRH